MDSLYKKLDKKLHNSQRIRNETMQLDSQI